MLYLLFGIIKINDGTSKVSRRRQTKEPTELGRRMKDELRDGGESVSGATKKARHGSVAHAKLVAAGISWEAG